MYIGLLNNIKETTYTHAGTAVPFAPASITDAGVKFNWRAVFDMPIDVNMTLNCECYVGAVTAFLSEKSTTGVEILIDGEPSGKYSAETGKTTGGKITVPVGKCGTVVTLRIYTSLLDVLLKKVEILGAYDDEKTLVWPTPKNIEYLGGKIKLSVTEASSDDKDEIFAKDFLAERLTENLGAWQSAGGAKVIFKKDSSAAYDGERYTVEFKNNAFTVTAKTRIALLYGADTILQLSDKNGTDKVMCDDKPSKEFRGFHSGVPATDQFEFARRFFRYVLLPLRYNTLFVEVSGVLKLKRHPEIGEAWRAACLEEDRLGLRRVPHRDMNGDGEVLEQEKVMEYIGYARELGFEIVPEIQSLGHVQYITLAHPELAEIDDEVVVVEDTRDEDERPDAKLYHCYCPSLEASYDLIFDIIDEVVEVIKPERYVHIGHDEIYNIGVCKRCRDKKPADIYKTHVTRLHDHLKELGLGTMMWSDMIQEPPTVKYETRYARYDLPKDIIMLDFVWYFNFAADIEDYILPAGYTMGIGNLYSSHFPRYESRIIKDNVIGGEMSTWVKFSEEILGNNGKIWDAIYLSEMLWDTERYDSRNRRSYSEIISKYIQPKVRDHIRGKYSVNGYSITDIMLPTDTSLVPSDVKALAPEAIVMAEQKIAVNGCYDRLLITHASINNSARIIWTPFVPYGEYVLTYEDGEKVSIPLKYAENIMAYKSFYADPLPQQYYRHNGYVGTWFQDPRIVGKNEAGEDITLSSFVYENPNPDKKISSIEYKAYDNDYIGVIVAKVEGLNKNN